MKSRRADTAGPDTDRTSPPDPAGGPAPGLRQRRHGDDWWSPARARARKRRQVAVGVLGVYSMLSNTAAPLIKIAAAPAMNSVGAASLGAASLGAAVLGPGSALAQQKGQKGEKGYPGDPGTEYEPVDKGRLHLNEPRVVIPAPPGDPGRKGPTGDPGEMGGRGPSGEPATKGERGDPGPSQPQGPKGDAGETGEAGPDGPQGDKGARGPKGPQGDKGLDALKGELGPTGRPGATGPQGDKGARGPKGPEGDKGLDALKGELGPTGRPGATGPQGDKGDQGPTGAPGTTAGAPGAAGQPGTAGAAGQPGTAGQPGQPGEKGEAGEDFALTEEARDTVRQAVASLRRSGTDSDRQVAGLLEGVLEVLGAGSGPGAAGGAPGVTDPQAPQGPPQSDTLALLRYAARPDTPPEAGAYAMAGAVHENRQDIDALQYRFRIMGNEMREATAVAIALGSIHIPMDSARAVSVQLGHFRDANALAVGGGVRVDESWHVNFGASLGLSYQQLGLRASVGYAW